MQRVFELTPGHICKKNLCPVPHRDTRQMKIIKSIPPSPVMSFPFWGKTWMEDAWIVWVHHQHRLPSYDSEKRIRAMLLQTHPKWDRTEGQTPTVSSPTVPQPKNSRRKAQGTHNGKWKKRMHTSSVQHWDSFIDVY